MDVLGHHTGGRPSGRSGARRGPPNVLPHRQCVPDAFASLMNSSITPLPTRDAISS